MYFEDHFVDQIFTISSLKITKLSFTYIRVIFFEYYCDLMFDFKIFDL